MESLNSKFPVVFKNFKNKTKLRKNGNFYEKSILDLGITHKNKLL